MLLASNQHIKSTSPTIDCQLSNMQLESNHHVEEANIMMAKSRNIIDDQATSHSFIWCCCFKSWSPKLPLVQSLFFSFRVAVSKIRATRSHSPRVVTHKMVSKIFIVDSSKNQRDDSFRWMPDGHAKSGTFGCWEPGGFRAEVTEVFWEKS